MSTSPSSLIHSGNNDAADVMNASGPIGISTQGRISLRKQVDLDKSLPPQPSAARKRLMDIHVTAYPGIINADLLPERALAAEDFTEIDPLSYRKGLTVKNQNAESSSLATAEDAEAPLIMMTTSQMASKMMQLGMELRKKQSPDMSAIEPRGYRKRDLAPPFDERSTYRLDYCQEADRIDVARRRRTLLKNYRNTWDETEKDDIDGSMKYPYLTLPESQCKNQPTMYRRDYNPEADRQDFRTLSHKTNLSDLGTSFAYSAYCVDDSRRRIPFNASIASLRDPHSVLEKTISPRDSFLDKTLGTTNGSASRGSITRAELDELRAQRRATVRRSIEKKTQPVPTAEEIAQNANGSIVIPGMSGAGYRRAPVGDNEYVYLPRDHFCHGSTDEF